MSFAPTEANGKMNKLQLATTPSYKLHSCYKPWSEKTTTISRHLPGGKHPSEHPSTLYMVPSTATNRHAYTDVKWGYWNAFYSHSESGGAPGPESPWTAALVCISGNKGEQVTIDWRNPEQQCVKEVALCCPQANPLSLLATSPAVYNQFV